MIAFGHSILAMSGEESLAQINREIEAPKLKNLLRTGLVIFIYSLLLTIAGVVFRRDDHPRQRPHVELLATI